MAVSNLMNRSFATRTISGILLVIICLFTIILGKDVLFFTVLAVSLIGMWELYRVFQIHKNIVGLLGYLEAIAYYVLIRLELEQYVFMSLILSIMLLMAVYVFTFPKYKTQEILVSFFGIFYVAIMLSFLYRIRMQEGGLYTVWLVFLSSWCCDTCAYLAGVTMGKHKMAPVLSPKKSVEGGIGGLVGAALLGLLFAYVFRDKLDMISRPMIAIPIISVIGGIISMVGDLAASAIKRNHEIKDYGTLIPGHGGILDRFDSVIFTAPIIYYLLSFL